MGPREGRRRDQDVHQQAYERGDAFLFGRQTYEIFARGWGVMDRGSHPIADALNTNPTYLASTTIADPQWANTTVLSSDHGAPGSGLRGPRRANRTGYEGRVLRQIGAR
jgi:hypothetical protein